MKRELAALEIDSESIDGKTRSSKQRTEVDSNRFFGRLVYKRTRRSIQFEGVDAGSSSWSNVVVQGLEDHAVVSSPEVGDSVRVKEPENTQAEGVERESGQVESAGDEGVQHAAEPKMVEVEEPRELPLEKIKKVASPMKDNVIVTNLAVEENGVFCAKDGRLSNLLDEEEEKHLMREVNKDEIVDQDLSACPSNVANNETEDPSVVQLKSAEDTLTVDNEYVFGNGDYVDEATVARSVKVGEAGISSHTQMTEYTGEVENSSVGQRMENGSCPALKPTVEGTESCMDAARDERDTKCVIDDENVKAVLESHVEESMSATPKRKLEMKMSKQITVAHIPTTVKELFETGLLEGCPVYYNGGKGAGLPGRIRGIGILCFCGLCQGSKVIPPSLFEIHACNSYKRAAQYICLENGRNFIQILKECKSARLNTLEATVENAIGPLPERKLMVCQNCQEPYSTMDAESSEAVCSSCVMSNLSPIGPVYSFRKTCRSSKSIHPARLSQSASSCAVHPERSREKLVEKSANASPMPKLRYSPRSPEVSVIAKIRSSPRFGKSSESKAARKTTEKSSKVCPTPKLRSSPRLEKSSGAKATKKIGKSQQEVPMVPMTCDAPSVEKSLETRSFENTSNKFSSEALSPKPAGSTRAGKTLRANDHGKTNKRSRREAIAPKPSKSPSIRSSSEKRISGKITRKDLRQHKMVFEDDVLPDGTELGYYARGQKLLGGYKKGSGIFCGCCDSLVSASQFEAHAGCASRKKPYCYIYTSNGVSLHELSVNLIKFRKQSAKFNDDLCSICADGGSLLLCDGCPRSFHMHCASLQSVPHGKWYCKYCQNMFEREKFVAHNANAWAAGRVSGVDPIEQISRRSIRIVDSLASELSSCILCRGYDFCKSGFGPCTIILCDQCEKEYHVGCLKDHNMADLTELPDGKWFCSMDCGRIDSALQTFLVRGAEKLPESLLDVVRKKHLQTGLEYATDVDICWRLLSGKVASPETKPLLSQAVAIFHESFAPIIDTVSGRDLIPAMVYGRTVAGQEYGGMYCAVLTINSVVVSAGIFRVFGPEVAELPLVATSAGNHGKGYFQALFACIESVLAHLKVKSFVLPAAEEAESIWTDRFGFTKMTIDQLTEFKRNYWSMVRFQGTSMLHKFIPEGRVIQS